MSQVDNSPTSFRHALAVLISQVDDLLLMAFNTVFELAVVSNFGKLDLANHNSTG
jgi:hypothetical protein